MAKMNWSRVVLGGVLWAVVFNVVWLSAYVLFLRSEWLREQAALGRPFPETLGTLALWLLITLVGGIVAIWLYAAIRPRYGPGPKTAIYVGVAYWLVGVLLPMVWLGRILALPAGLVVTTSATQLVAMVAATVLGAWSYKEE